MQTITATAVWSVALTVKVPDDATVEEKQDAIMHEAINAYVDLNHPIIHECSDPDCID